EDAAYGHLGNIALQDVQVGPADGGRVHLDNDVRWTLDDWIRNLLPRLLSGTFVYECLHGRPPELFGEGAGTRARRAPTESTSLIRTLRTGLTARLEAKVPRPRESCRVRRPGWNAPRARRLETGLRVCR